MRKLKLRGFYSRERDFDFNTINIFTLWSIQLTLFHGNLKYIFPLFHIKCLPILEIKNCRLLISKNFIIILKIKGQKGNYFKNTAIYTHRLDF